MFTSSALYLASVAATLLQTDVVTQSTELPSLCMKPSTGEWVIVNPINPSGPALGYGILPAELLNEASISGADCMPPLPDNLISWLKYVDDAKEYIARHPESAVSEAERLSLAPATEVSPIMPNIAWDQGDPFNKFVPAGCPTGCVATALSQIMYYYRYPELGSGYHSYTWQGHTHEVNFAEEFYDWDQMFDQYLPRVHTEEQKEAVAKLCYHVGVAMDMMYAPGGSGAYDMRVNESMRDYFSYNPYGTVINRFAFGLANWSGILNRELSLGHPVYMSGSSNEGGHAFVIDGVNEQDYYHVNWGWGGAYNGWYDISIMHPAGVGTGASPSDDGFAWNQAIYAGFTPDVPVDSVFYTTIMNYYIDAQVQNDTVVSNLWLFNTSATTQKGTVYYDLMQGDSLIIRQQVLDDFSYRYWRENGGTVNFILPESMADGDYQLRLSFRNQDGLWSTIYGYRPNPDYIKLTVEDGIKTAWTDEIDVRMTTTQWDFENLYAGHDNTLSSLIRNDGEEKIAGLWFLLLTYSDGSFQQIEATDIVTIAPQEEKWVTFKTSFESQGECLAQIVMAKQSENDREAWIVQHSDTILNILDDGTFGADLSLTDNIYLQSGDCEVNGTITIGADIKNDGSAYNGELSLKIFADKNFKTEVMSYTTDFTIEEQENKTALLSIKLDKAKAKRSYYASVFMRRGSQYVAIPGTNQLKLIVKEEGSAAGIETVVTDPETPAVRMDLYGRPLTGSHSGFELRQGKIYFIQ